MASKLLAQVRKRVNWVVQHHAEYVTATYVPPGKQPPDLAGECVEVETAEQLEQVAPEIPPIYPLKRLREAIQQGKIILLLRAQAPQGGDRRTLVGFRVCERGKFHSLGRRMVLPETALFTHYAEVFQEFRGRRYAIELGKCARRFGMRRGISLFCGTVASTNRAALNAHIRTGNLPVVATVHRFGFFGGRFVWVTSAAKILKALDSVSREEEID